MQAVRLDMSLDVSSADANVVKGDDYVSTFMSFIAGLPKAELHAHISGSIRTSTLRELVLQHFTGTAAEDRLKQCKLRVGDENDTRDLNECFAMFKVLHHVIDSKQVLRRITLESLIDFVYEDKVAYLELRTTPRAILANDGRVSVSKREYLDIVCSAIDDFKAAVCVINSQSSGDDANNENKTHITNSDVTDTIVKDNVVLPGPAPHFIDAALLVSIDRSNAVEDARETLAVVAELKREGRCVCGLDFSGNPFSKKFGAFKDVFENARDVHNIGTAIHFAETSDVEDAQAILDFKPDRLGHAAVLSEELLTRVIDSKIPVEICFTSNLACKLHGSVVTHPFHRMFAAAHSLTLCTDDKGIFNTTLCKEYAHLLHYPEFAPPLTASSPSSPAGAALSSSSLRQYGCPACAETNHSDDHNSCGATGAEEDLKKTVSCSECSTHVTSSVTRDQQGEVLSREEVRARLSAVATMVMRSVDSWLASEEVKQRGKKMIRSYVEEYFSSKW